MYYTSQELLWYLPLPLSRLHLRQGFCARVYITPVFVNHFVLLYDTTKYSMLM